jgi:hypothetical protein
MQAALATIDLAQLDNVNGGYDWKRTGKAMLGGSVAGAGAGAVGAALTGPLAVATIAPAAGVGAITGAVGAGIYDAGSQFHLW